MIALVSLLAAAALPAMEEPVPGFESGRCSDRFGRQITYYLSPADPDAAKPVALIILGSGGQSIWRRMDGRIAGGLQNLFLNAVKDDYRVLVVEKPGVPFAFDPPQPGTAIGCPPEFLAEHTLERWVEANAAALRAAWEQPGSDPSQTLVVGHSEGAQIGAALSRKEPRVTHLAMLAGGGANQLFDFALMSERGHPGASQAVYAEWEKIRQNPESVTQMAWGHSYRYWSSMLATSTLDEALASQAKLFAANGTEDEASPIESFEVLRAGLAQAGRKAELQRIEGADHGFQPLGFTEIFRRVLKWAKEN